MSQESTVARPYAKALFALAQKENALALWSDMLSMAATVAKDKQVLSLIKDPNCSQEQLVHLFVTIGEGLYTQEMQSFIQVLATFKRLRFLPEVFALYQQMREKAERVVTVELISAYPLNEEESLRFQKALKRKMNCDILLQSSVDKTILGGAIVRSGDLVIDGSIRGRLSRLTDALGVSF